MGTSRRGGFQPPGCNEYGDGKASQAGNEFECETSDAKRENDLSRVVVSSGWIGGRVSLTTLERSFSILWPTRVGGTELALKPRPSFSLQPGG